MPELPEVQTVVNDLNRKIVGQEIVDFWTDWGRAIKDISVSDFRRKIINTKIVEIRRRAKNILIFLDSGRLILIHLKMTGHLLVKKESNSKDKYFQEKVNQYIHHKWFLKDKNNEELILNFSDLRKFGKIMLLDAENYLESKELVHFGREPLEDEFDFNCFWEILKRKPKKKIRLLLLDQDLIAGIGNIYVSEILFAAGVRADRLVKDISKLEANKIFNNIKKILNLAIKKRGTSDSDYRDIDGKKGVFQKFLKVYGREGQFCLKEDCKGVVIRRKIGQRSSFECSFCQK